MLRLHVTPDPGEAAADVALDGAERNVGALGDLGMGEILEECQCRLPVAAAVALLGVEPRRFA